MENEQINEIRTFLDADGRLNALPAKRRKKIIALCFLADQIPPEARYTERSFSDLLNTLHTFGDPATLRREMFDCYLIDRDNDGTNYRLSPERPDVETLLAEKCK